MVDQNSAAILGATSGLGQALARALAGGSTPLCLVARDEQKLAVVANDLSARGAIVESVVADFDQLDQHQEWIDRVCEQHTVFVVYGTLPDQQACEKDWQQAENALMTNFISVTSVLTRVAEQFEQRGHGTIVVVSSVAGDRGRKSNYVYGAAKGGLTVFCDGMRNRLASAGVQLLCVKPGFIDTPMTAHIEKKPAALWVGPDRVASDILKAVKSKRNTLYTPWFWRYIMLIIKSIPEFIFKRLSL